MISEIVNAISVSTLDDVSKARVTRCVPLLAEALDGVGPAGLGSGVILAAATTLGAIVITAPGWPELTEEAIRSELGNVERAVVANAVAAAIESPTFMGDQIMSGVCVLLGAANLATLLEDSRRIVARGELPLAVALLAREGTAISTLVTAIGLRPASVHSNCHYVMP